MYNKIGFHVGPSGNSTGLDQHLNELNEAGVPFALKSVDDYAYCRLAVQIAIASTVPHLIVFRLSGQGFDVPDYSLSPQMAAIQHWQRILDKLPPDFNRNLVWIEPINEVDKDRSDWLGHFCSELALIATEQGYKITSFGWSSGEPEPNHWQLPGMKRYLQLCAQNRDNIAISLHEYSYDLDDIKNGYPYLIGRFQFLLDACDEMSIGYPVIHITEWGWAYNDVPDVSEAMQDIKWANEMYNEYPSVKGAGLWYLGGQFGGIANRAQKLIQPTTEYSLTFDPVFGGNPIDPNPDPDPINELNYTVRVNLYPQNYTRVEYQTVVDHTFTNKEDMTGSADSAGFLAQHGKKPNSRVIVWNPERIGTGLTQQWFDTHYPGAIMETKTIAQDIQLSMPLTGAYAITSRMNDLRDYDGDGNSTDLHEGTDFAPLQNNPNSMAIASADGIVDRVITKTTGYGKYIVVKHDNGRYFTWYCHLDSFNVSTGQSVNKGQILGKVGSTGNSTGRHLHFNLQVPENGLDGYVVSDILNPLDYLNLTPIQLPQGGYSGPPITTFIKGIDQAASDWYWPQTMDVFDRTGLEVKFHSNGRSSDYFDLYKNDVFNPVRIILDPSFTGNQLKGSVALGEAIFNEVRVDVQRFYDKGARDFIVLNEPNIEGMGIRWDNGKQFGTVFKSLCQNLLNRYVGIRLWYPGCSPGFGAQHIFINDSKTTGAFDLIYGVVEHVYTGVTNGEPNSVAQSMVNEVLDFQSKHTMNRPLMIGEFSVNRPATKEYKRDVYKAFFSKLSFVKGIQAAYSFTSSWHPNPDENKEGWLELGIHNVW